VVPIDTDGVAVHQLVADAGSATADSVKELTMAAKNLLRDVKKRDLPEFWTKRPCALFSADLLFMDLAPVWSDSELLLAAGLKMRQALVKGKCERLFFFTL
jgi:hypothetical protein